MFVSNVVMYFIILTTAATLHAHGRTEITSAQEAAEALRPLAGEGAYWLFTIGIIGTGILSVPILAGSCAYAISEAAAWRGSLDQRPKDARGFYAVVAVAMVLGLGLDFAGYNAVAMLFWSAVVNGVLAPPLIVLILLLTSDAAVMGPNRTNPLWLRALGWTTAIVMAVAAVAMFVTAAV
jgi:Mn2+/Fe2+ NRAMP family transporter